MNNPLLSSLPDAAPDISNQLMLIYSATQVGLEAANVPADLDSGLFQEPSQSQINLNVLHHANSRGCSFIWKFLQFTHQHNRNQARRARVCTRVHVWCHAAHFEMSGIYLFPLPLINSGSALSFRTESS